MTSAEFDQLIGALRDRDGDKLCLDAADTIAEMATPSTAISDEPVAAALLAVLDDKLAMYADIRQHGGLTECGEHGELVVQGLRAAMGCVADRYAATSAEPVAWQRRFRLGLKKELSGWEPITKNTYERMSHDMRRGMHADTEIRPLYAAPTLTPSDALTDSPDILLLMEAAQGVLDANADFRSKLPDDWDGDPLEDACEELRIALGVQGGKLATRPSPAPAAVEALEDAETWCEMQARAIGNVDGYDYRSGEEAAYRHAAIELKKRAAALSQSRNDRGSQN